MRSHEFSPVDHLRIVAQSDSDSQSPDRRICATNSHQIRLRSHIEAREAFLILDQKHYKVTTTLY